MNSRIKQIRKTLGLNQTEFSKEIGIKQAGLSAIEKGLRNLTDRNISLICQTFNVNEDWLRTGNGEIFKKPDIKSISGIHNMTEEETKLIKTFMDMLPDERKVVIDFVNLIKNKSID